MKKLALLGLVPIAAVPSIIATTSCGSKSDSFQAITRAEWFAQYEQYYTTYNSLIKAGTKYTKDDIAIVQNGEKLTVNSVEYKTDGTKTEFIVNIQTSSGEKDNYYLAGDTVAEMELAFPDNDKTKYYQSGEYIKIHGESDDEIEEITINSSGYFVHCYEYEPSESSHKLDVNITYNK